MDGRVQIILVLIRQWLRTNGAPQVPSTPRYRSRGLSMATVTGGDESSKTMNRHSYQVINSAYPPPKSTQSRAHLSRQTYSV